MSYTQKIDVLDMIINVLQEHEKNISDNIEELNYLLDKYTDIIEAQSLLLQAVCEKLCNQNIN